MLIFTTINQNIELSLSDNYMSKDRSYLLSSANVTNLIKIRI